MSDRFLIFGTVNGVDKHERVLRALPTIDAANAAIDQMPGGHYLVVRVERDLVVQLDKGQDVRTVVEKTL
jgi:hypothetical protein